jgi:starch-binding outer membrane protein, SusD/RagB family
VSCGEQMSDNGHAIGAVDDKHVYKDYLLKPSNTIVYSHWKQYYSSIFNVNNVIYTADGADVEDSYKEQVLS